MNAFGIDDGTVSKGSVENGLKMVKGIKKESALGARLRLKRQGVDRKINQGTTANARERANRNFKP